MLGYDVDLKDREAVGATVVTRPQDDDKTLTAEQVAKVVAGVCSIGGARTALEKAGWRATIAGNRITVIDEVIAQFIAASVGPHGLVDAQWVIYRIAGTRPVWVVGAEPLL